MKLKTVKYAILLFIGISSSNAIAQEIYLTTGKTSSSFKYKDSQGIELDVLEATSNTYITAGYRTNSFIKNLNGSFGLGYFGYGAIGSDKAILGVMEWKANYLELNLGLDYVVYNTHNTSFYLKETFSTGFLVYGTQTLNDEIINLKKVDDFNKTMISFKMGAGVSHKVSKNLSFNLEYFFGRSLNQSNGNDRESLIIRSHNVGLGVLINVLNDNY